MATFPTSLRLPALLAAVLIVACGSRTPLPASHPAPTIACGDPGAGPAMAQEARTRGFEAAVLEEHGSAQLAGALVSVQRIGVDQYPKAGNAVEVGPRAYLIVTYGPQGLVHAGQQIAIQQRPFRVAYIYAPPPSCPATGSVPALAKATVTLVEDRAMPTPGQAPPPAPAPRSIPPASTYGALAPEACASLLRERGIPHELVTKATPGVALPLRITGPMNGVVIHQLKSSFDILDCRLALALDDFTRLLAKHGIVSVVHWSMYRPSAVIAHSGEASQHSYGLAIDIAELVRADGTRLNVTRDWSGAIGDEVCPAGWDRAGNVAGQAVLRAVACEAGEAQLFHVILTPNANRDHRTHFHMDLTPGADYVIIR